MAPLHGKWGYCPCSVPITLVACRSRKCRFIRSDSSTRTNSRRDHPQFVHFRQSFFSNALVHSVGKMTVHADAVIFAYATDRQFDDHSTDAILRSTHAHPEILRCARDRYESSFFIALDPHQGEIASESCTWHILLFQS